MGSSAIGGSGCQIEIGGFDVAKYMGSWSAAAVGIAAMSIIAQINTGNKRKQRRIMTAKKINTNF
jgi:hypothetical protein